MPTRAFPPSVNRREGLLRTTHRVHARRHLQTSSGHAEGPIWTASLPDHQAVQSLVDFELRLGKPGEDVLFRGPVQLHASDARSPSSPRQHQPQPPLGTTQTTRSNLLRPPSVSRFSGLRRGAYFGQRQGFAIHIKQMLPVSATGAAGMSKRKCARGGATVLPCAPCKKWANRWHVWASGLGVPYVGGTLAQGQGAHYVPPDCPSTGGPRSCLGHANKQLCAWVSEPCVPLAVLTPASVLGRFIATPWKWPRPVSHTNRRAPQSPFRGHTTAAAASLPFSSPVS